MKKYDFTKEVEKLIDPITVGTIHFIQYFNSLLPKSVQRKVMESSSKKTPYMGFVVEPYSYFLCYEIKDIKYAESLIPDNFELIKTSIFACDEPKYYGIFGFINAHTSAFFGLRVEFYIIALNKLTGLLSWIIIDYDTNTITYDNKNGLRSPNSSGSVITTDYNGNVIADVKNANHQFAFISNIKNGVMTNLDQRLWLEGNLSIGYGKNLSKLNGDIFSLKFNPSEVKEALRIDSKDLDITTNTWYPGLLEDSPSEIVCFPYAQHYVSDAPGYASNLKDREELEDSIGKIDFDNIQVFSTTKIRKMFLIGSLISMLIIVILIILLIFK